MCSQCEWLLGDRRPSPEELDKGIDPDSPLFQAILDNPVVQLGLTNPKTLLGVCLLSACAGAGPACRMDVAGRYHSRHAQQLPLQGPGRLQPESPQGPEIRSCSWCDSLLCGDSIHGVKNQLEWVI